MQRIFTILITIFVLLSQQGIAQSPEEMSYQAVVRNSDGRLITNQQIGMQISILKHLNDDITVVYIETRTLITNINGLIAMKIGSRDGFSSIDWANGTYFIKTEIDPTGGTDYTITSTSQLLSVPYALHAKTAESVVGGVIDEEDPRFIASPASGITEKDLTNWNNKLDSYTENDPVFTSSAVGSVTTSDITSWNNKLDSYTENDPVFTSSAVGSVTTSDITSWNNKLDSYTENDPVFTSSAAGSITTSDITNWNNKLDSYAEADPKFNSSLASNITTSDTARWNNYSRVDTDFNKFYHGKDTLGGIIFHIYKGSDGTQQGLIVAKTEGTAGFQNTATTTNATSSWNGDNNTGLLDDSPAKTYVESLGEGWYLPSVDELNLLWRNRYSVNKTLSESGEDPISNMVTYWSSTEHNQDNAFFFSFYSGISFSDNKTQQNSVRAIRYFTVNHNVDSDKFYFGKDTLGGIVFHVYEDTNGEQHGLIIAKSEDVAQYQSIAVTTNATSSWNGSDNTVLLSNSPAKTYVQSLEESWYIPSIDELNILWRNRYFVNKTLTEGGSDPISNMANFWSSTEHNAVSAFFFSFYSGISFSDDKTYEKTIRAIRAF